MHNVDIKKAIQASCEHALNGFEYHIDHNTRIEILQAIEEA